MPEPLPTCRSCGGHTALRVQTLSNGAKHLRFQCQKCGAAVGTMVRQVDAHLFHQGPVPPWNERLVHATEAAEQAQREEESKKWWLWYNGYLQSPEWRARRELVLRRAGGTCEGCGLQPAQHVHHRTYDDVGQELLFQLVALCVPCHERVHKPNPHRMPIAVALLEAEKRHRA